MLSIANANPIVNKKDGNHPVLMNCAKLFGWYASGHREGRSMMAFYPELRQTSRTGAVTLAAGFLAPNVSAFSQPMISK